MLDGIFEGALFPDTFFELCISHDHSIVHWGIQILLSPLAGHINSWPSVTLQVVFPEGRLVFHFLVNPATELFPCPHIIVDLTVSHVETRFDY